MFNLSDQSGQSETIRVLLIEDNPGDARLIQEMLSEIPGKPFAVDHAGRLAEALDSFKRAYPDVILADLGLPDSQGVDTFKSIYAAAPRIPIVVATSLSDSGIVALSLGAQDYLIKDKIDAETLSRALRYAIERNKLRTSYEDLVNTITHELRIPLGIMREGISQICDGLHGAVSEKSKEFLVMAIHNIDRLKRLVDNLLGVAKLDSGNMRLSKTIFDINELAREMQAIFAAQAKNRDIRLFCTVPPGVLEVYADRDRIAEVLTNLIGNAFKFTERGSVEIVIVQKGEFIECSVRDTGPGIPAEYLSRVFERFQQFTRKTATGEKGTGLGLAIAKGILDLHNETISVESSCAGSVFTFTLRRYQAQPLFKEHIDSCIAQAAGKNVSFSLIAVSGINPEILQHVATPEAATQIVTQVHAIFKSSMRRVEDSVFDLTNEMLVLLVDCDREGVAVVKSRLAQQLFNYLASNGFSDKISLRFGCVTYPDDASSREGLLAAVRSQL
jgi:signal transduction histidine kinase